MAHQYKFCERYKEKICFIEEKLSVKEKEDYRSLLNYDREQFVTVIDEAEYEQIKNLIQEIKRSEDSAKETYKKREIFAYIRKVLDDDLKYRDDTDIVMDGDILLILFRILCDKKDEWNQMLERLLKVEGITEEYEKQNRTKEIDEKWEKAKAYKSEDIWSMRKKLSEIPIIYSMDGLGVRNDVGLIEEMEQNLVIELIFGWKKRAEEVAGNSRRRNMQILLCCAEDITKIRQKFLKDLKIRKKNWGETKIVDAYFEFLYINVFPNSQFWKMIFDKKAAEQRFFDQMLNVKMKRGCYTQEEVLEKEEKIRQIEKHLLMSDQEEELLYEISWHCPEKEDDLFQENFQRYSFRRCFGALYWKYFGGEKGVENLLKIQEYQELGYKNRKDWEKAIHTIFLKWSSPYNCENFYSSLLKEILFCIINGETLQKSLCKTATYNSKNGYCLVDQREGLSTSIWCINEKSEENETFNLNKHFSPEYQVIKTRAKSKIKKPKTLIDEEIKAINEIEYFESYMYEMQKGVLSAWKLYSLVFELANFEKESKNLQDAVSRLSESIGTIHNLELRLYVIKELKPMIDVIRDNRYVSMESSLRQIAAILNEEAKIFNEKYDKMALTLLWIYKDEENWKDILWLKNIENEQFSELLSEIKGLQKESGKESYIQRKFESIYKEQQKAKGRMYSVYDKIWAGLKEKYSSDIKWLYEWN